LPHTGTCIGSIITAEENQAEKSQALKAISIFIAGCLIAAKKNPPALSNRWVNNKSKPEEEEGVSTS